MANTSTTQGRSPGRPSKGPRKVAAAVLPLAVREECDRRWRAEGYDSLSDFLTAIIAPAVGLPDAAPKPQHQEDRLIA